MRHATSKLSDSKLIKIKYLGFRGEALSSIAAVSRMKLSSKTSGAKVSGNIKCNFRGSFMEEEISSGAVC